LEKTRIILRGSSLNCLTQKPEDRIEMHITIFSHLRDDTSLIFAFSLLKCSSKSFWNIQKKLLNMQLTKIFNKLFLHVHWIWSQVVSYYVLFCCNCRCFRDVDTFSFSSLRSTNNWNMGNIHIASKHDDRIFLVYFIIQEQ